MDSSRQMPHDYDAEKAVIGSMLVDKDAVIEAVEVLRDYDFYSEINKQIYVAMLDLYNVNSPIDIITVKAELTTKGILDKVGGLEYLSSLAEAIPTTANVIQYIKIVEDKSLLRRLIKSSNEIATLGYEESEEVSDIMEKAEKSIFEISQKKNQKGYVPIKDVLVDTFSRIEELYNNKKPVTGIPTGYTDFDYKTAGLNKSDLILVAGRPAMGKTAFALNVCQYAAVHANVPVAIFSLEMSKEQLVSRLLCSESMVDNTKVKTGKIEEDDWIKLAKSLGPLSEAPIYIDDTPGLSIVELKAKCRKLKMEKDIGLIVIDYLQLMQASSGSRSREQEISEISRSLKIIAKELNIPVIACSQLSRGPEGRQDHRPILSDLRESGAIEQDADIVLLLYRDDYYNPETEKKNIAEIIIAKHRSGSTGTVELLWLGQYTKFANIDKYR